MKDFNLPTNNNNFKKLVNQDIFVDKSDFIMNVIIKSD